MLTIASKTVFPEIKLLDGFRESCVNPYRILSANEFAPTEYRIKHKQVTLNFLKRFGFFKSQNVTEGAELGLIILFLV